MSQQGRVKTKSDRKRCSYTKLELCGMWCSCDARELSGMEMWHLWQSAHRNSVKKELLVSILYQIWLKLHDTTSAKRQTSEARGKLICIRKFDYISVPGPNIARDDIPETNLCLMTSRLRPVWSGHPPRRTHCQSSWSPAYSCNGRGLRSGHTTHGDRDWQLKAGLLTTTKFWNDRIIMISRL